MLEITDEKNQTFPIDGPKQLSELIRKRRKSKGITQEQVATYADISILVISELERQKSDIRLSSLLKILKVLDLKLTIREK